MREKLIELLNVGLDKIDRGSLPWAVEMLADHLIANGVTFAKDNDVPNKWISVKDRLPDMDEKCFLCMENRITKYRWVTIGYFHTNYDEYVTHWQYLPQPPKGE